MNEIVSETTELLNEEERKLVVNDLSEQQQKELFRELVKRKFNQHKSEAQPL